MQQPSLAQAAKRLACPVLRFIGKSGCFVEGTLVVIDEEWVAVIVPVADDELAGLVPVALPDEQAAEWDTLCLVTLAGSLGLTLGGSLLLKRRRRAEELAPADKVWLDSDQWLNYKNDNADWEATLLQLARARVGLRQGGGGA